MLTTSECISSASGLPSSAPTHPVASHIVSVPPPNLSTIIPDILRTNRRRKHNSV